MATQLVYTSAAKLLDAGRSGFGTVARSKAISPLVVSAIERVSQFANMRGLDRTRAIHVHRQITAGSHRFQILTRIIDAGADYTGRTNHLAHHLIISQEEAAMAAAAGITPADVLQQFQWLGRWPGNARFFEPNEDVAITSFRPVGRDSRRQAWSKTTGNPAHARLLSWEGASRTGVLIVPETGDQLTLLAEALAEFGPQAWSRSFTTSLETTDELSELDWIVTRPAAFPEIQSRCGSRILLDLANPKSLPSPPATVAPSLAKGSPDTAWRSGSSSPGSPDVPSITRQAGTQAAGKSRAGSDSRMREWADIHQSRSADMSMRLVIGLVVVLLLGGGWFALKTLSSSPVPHSQSKLNEGQEQEIRDLVAIKILDKDARYIITKAGSYSMNWKNFIIDSNKKIQELAMPPVAGATERPSPAIPKPDKLEGAPAWTGDLVDAIQKLNGIDAVRYVDWIKQIKPLTSQLTTIKNDGGLPLVSGDLENLDIMLFQRFAAIRLGYILKDSTDLNDGKLNNLLKEGKDYWHNPKCLELLFDKIQNALPAQPGPKAGTKYFELKAAVYPHKELFVDDYTGLEAAEFLFKGAEEPKDLSNARKTLILNSRLVPQSFKGKLGMSPTKSPHQPAPQPAKSPLDLTRVPARQILVVSRDDLNRGVPVKLLDAVMKSLVSNPKPEKITLDALATHIDTSNKPEKTELLLLDKKEVYCWTKTPAQDVPKYHINGRFAVEKKDVMTARFTCDNKEAWIVVDESPGEPIHQDLKFKIELSGDTAQIKGTLADWIRNVEPADRDLQLIINDGKGKPADVSILGVTKELPGCPRPLIADQFFPLRDAENLRRLRQDIQRTKDSRDGLPQKTLKEKNVKLTEMCDGLIRLLEESMGVAFASKCLSKPTMMGDPFTKDEREKIIAALKNVPKLDANKIAGFSSNIESSVTAKTTHQLSYEKEIGKAANDERKKQLRNEQNAQSQNDDTTIAISRKQFIESVGWSILMAHDHFGLPVPADFKFSSLVLPSEPIANNACNDQTAFFDLIWKKSDELSVPIGKRRDEYLGKITTLRVRTRNGRALFDATHE